MSATIRPVTMKHLGIAAAVLLADTAQMLVVGVAMWKDAPFPADAAVGKGLVALGCALAVPAVVLGCAVVDAWVRTARPQEPARSDWDTV